MGNILEFIDHFRRRYQKLSQVGDWKLYFTLCTFIFTFTLYSSASYNSKTLEEYMYIKWFFYIFLLGDTFLLTCFILRSIKHSLILDTYINLGVRTRRTMIINDSFKMGLYISSILHINPPPTTLRPFYILFHLQTTNFVESSSIKWNWSRIKILKSPPFHVFEIYGLIYLRQAYTKTKKSDFYEKDKIRKYSINNSVQSYNRI